MLDWLNFCLGEITGLIHALEKRHYQNKTQLRYNFGSVYKKKNTNKTYGLDRYDKNVTLILKLFT